MIRKLDHILSGLILFLITGFSVKGQIPAYLQDFREHYKKNPSEANLQWFKDARFGMFIHYGLYSQLEKGEWVQLRDTIPLDEYASPDVFPIEETYELIRNLSPHALISFKQGANGDEDFVASERGGGARVGQQYPVSQRAYELNKNKPKEVCNTMQQHLPGAGANWG